MSRESNLDAALAEARLDVASGEARLDVALAEARLDVAWAEARLDVALAKGPGTQCHNPSHHHRNGTPGPHLPHCNRTHHLSDMRHRSST